MDEIDLIREGYDLDVYTVFGNDPYTIPLILLTQAWMNAVPPEERDALHLWGFIRRLKPEIPIPPDVIYRNRMITLRERDVVEAIKIGGRQRPKYDYVLTEYGQAVCKKHMDSLSEQIRLEKWRRRALGRKSLHAYGRL